MSFSILYLGLTSILFHKPLSIYLHAMSEIISLETAMRSMFLVAVCFIWILFSILQGWITRKFVYSKPAGRRMITAEITVLTLISGNFVVIVLCMEIILRTLLGSYSFWGVFINNEVLSIPVSLNLGSLNVAAFFQIAIIFDNR